MCTGGTPDVPSVPERQSVKQPVTDAGVRGQTNEDERRRRGMLATILTSPQGALTPASTTAAPEKTKLGA